MDTVIDPQLLLLLMKDVGYPIVISLLLLYYIYRVTLPLVSTVDDIKDMISDIKKCITEVKNLVRHHVQGMK
jgi:hypothetical protein